MAKLCLHGLLWACCWARKSIPEKKHTQRRWGKKLPWRKSPCVPEWIGENSLGIGHEGMELLDPQFCKKEGFFWNVRKGT